jgi:hypothetical protein
MCGFAAHSECLLLGPDSSLYICHSCVRLEKLSFRDPTNRVVEMDKAFSDAMKEQKKQRTLKLCSEETFNDTIQKLFEPPEKPDEDYVEEGQMIPPMLQPSRLLF